MTSSHPQPHRWTWYSNAGGVVKEIDHVLIHGRLRMFRNCRVYRSAQFLNIDHRLVVATLKSQLKSKRMLSSQPRLVVGKLKEERVAEEFASRLSGVLGRLDALGDPEELWSAFKTTILDVASGCLGTHHQVKKNFVFQETLDIINLSRRARLDGRVELFRELRRKTVRSLRVYKEAYVRGICERVEHQLWTYDSHPACRGIRALRSSKPVPRCTAVRAEGGGLLAEGSEVKARWARYFERLYQADPPAVELDVRGVAFPNADLPINCEPPSLVEMQAAVNRLKGKAPGICGIHAEILKADDEVIFAETLDILTGALQALNEEVVPLGLRISWVKTKIQAFNDILDAAVLSVPVCGEDVEFAMERPGQHKVLPTTTFEDKVDEVRQTSAHWETYFRSQMISHEDMEFITRFQMSSHEQRQELLDKEGFMCAKTFLNLMTHISREQTVQFVLTLVDDILQENHSRVQIFFDHARRTKTSPWSHFLPMLNRQDPFTANQAARIISKLATSGKQVMEGSDLNCYFNWIKIQLSSQSCQYLQCVAGCLQLMHHVNHFRYAWVQVGGVECILSVLKKNCGFQLQYQLCFCLWLLAYCPELCHILRTVHAVPVLAKILQESVKEKVTRIILATFRNLLERTEEREAHKDLALAMIEGKVLKQLENLEKAKSDDEDVVDDIRFLLKILGKSLQELCSFDEYVSEIRSGRLKWSPVHRSEKFWRENATRFNENDYELLKILMHLLEHSQDPQVIAVATHDVGEYVGSYPRGSRVIEQLGGKELAMRHMHHPDYGVQHNALFAMQRLVMHNW
uniref:V-type proton ATPase subunit H-like n=1 Tax=Myxine glutinosa TaxID=7769 RepID=UPI00358E9E4B